MNIIRYIANKISIVISYKNNGLFVFIFKYEIYYIYKLYYIYYIL